MKHPFSRQSQFELFPDSPGQPPHKERSYVFGRSFQFSLENLIIAGIIFMMIMIVSFSFGIERGRRLTAARHAAKTAAPSVERQVPAQDPLAVKVRAKGADQVLAASFDVRPSYGEDVNLQPVQALQGQESASASEKSVDKTASLETIHTVQVASFKQLNRAEREADDLKKLGYDAFTAKKGTYYIVCVGRFAERHKAVELVKPLRKKYVDCYVRRL